MNKKYDNFIFVFHATYENKDLISKKIKHINLENTEVISEDNIKKQILNNSIFAVSKSGTVSLEICNANVPSIIIYKINFINFFIVKMLIKVKFANIINIAAGKEIIPELLQEKCNAKDIFNKVDEFLINPGLSTNQIIKFKEIIKNFKTNKSSDLASSVLINSL